MLKPAHRNNASLASQIVLIQTERSNKMGKSVGVDLGTKDPVVAVIEGRQPTVIANSDGQVVGE
jgi:Hsp70 protein